MKHLLSPALIALVFIGCRTQPTLEQPAVQMSNGLAYELRGSGSTIVLIHGSNLDRRMWEAEAAWLSETNRVLRYDQRGQGASEDPVGSFSNHDDLIALLDVAGSTTAVLVGLSSGAQIALDVALAAPERVSGLVLVSPSLRGYAPDSIPAFLTALSDALRAGEFERANQILVDSPLMSVPAESAASVRAMVDDNSRLWSIPYELVDALDPPAIERLESIRTPTLILAGENDLEAIKSQAELLEERLRDSQLSAVRGGGHLLNLTSPLEFRREVGAFLTKLDVDRLP